MGETIVGFSFSNLMNRIIITCQKELVGRHQRNQIAQVNDHHHHTISVQFVFSIMSRETSRELIWKYVFPRGKYQVVGAWHCRTAHDYIPT